MLKLCWPGMTFKADRLSPALPAAGTGAVADVGGERGSRVDASPGRWVKRLAQRPLKSAKSVISECACST